MFNDRSRHLLGSALTNNNIPNNCLQINFPKIFQQRYSTMANQRDSKLSTYPNYFISWLENGQDYVVQEDKITEMIDNLYEIFPRPYEKDDESSESEDEVDEDNTDGLSSSSSSNEVEEGLGDMFNLQRTMAPLVEAFLNILIGKLDLATTEIEWVEGEMDSHFRPGKVLKDYVQGYVFLIQLLKIHIGFVENLTDFDKELDIMIMHFDKLTNKEKSIILIGRWMLDETLRSERAALAIEHLTQASRLDPTNWVWNYVLCSRIRCHRKSGGVTGNAKPTEEEISAIAASVQYSPDCYRAMCVAGVCQCLAEVVKFNWYDRQYVKGPITMGVKTFKDDEDAIEFIKYHARKLFVRRENGKLGIRANARFPEFIRYGEIFMSILPPNYRDYDLARICFGYCVTIMPENSKVNHKMGILQLLGNRDIAKAVSYLEKAVRLHETNFPAIMDLLKTLLSSVADYDKELEETFSLAYKNYFWSTRQFSNLKFHEGCYLFLKNEVQKAVDCWLQLIPRAPTDLPNDFAGIYGSAKRHQWTAETTASLSKENIIKGIKSTMQETDDIKKLVSRIEEEMVDPPIRRGRFNQRDSRDNFDFRNMRKSITKVANHHGGTHYTQRQTPSVADEDNCWRTSGSIPSTSNTSESTNQLLRYHNRQSSEGSSGNRRNRNDSWKTQSSNRPPSPDNWRS